MNSIQHNNISKFNYILIAIKRNTLFLFVFLLATNVYSQEIISTLRVNPKLLKETKIKHIPLKSTSTSLHLPFIDDFSNYTGYPDANLWSDNYVFVNKQFALFPPTVGVATFDALDPNGYMYTWSSNLQFSADTLTSRAIRLDSVFQPNKALRISDSLYFSFYFQPGGGRGVMWDRIGNSPDADDSLVLEFYSPIQQKWNKIWATDGMPLDSIYLKDSSYFRYVLIPVKDSAKYYADGFRFRFRNYASLGSVVNQSWTSNCDEWNIDYVYLGINRTKFDTTRNDLSFIDAAPSFLKNYQAMPANQFQAADVKDSIEIRLSNLDGITQPSAYKYEIRDAVGTLMHTEDRGFENIPSFWLSGYQQAIVHSKPPVSYSFPTVNASNQTDFEIKHIFKEGVNHDLRPQNDTNIFNQRFENFYAYDDGTAENGYGLTPAGSKLAYKFTLHNPDTLVAVQMFFNSTADSGNYVNFYLSVWKDNGGIPGDTIYYAQQILPSFDSGLNQYHTYILKHPVSVSNTFYVGWIQTTDDNLNVGFDRNTDSHDKVFYNSSGAWQNSFIKGSLMIRPVFGLNSLGINEIAKNDFKYNIYPNPLNNQYLNIDLKTELNQSAHYSIQIYDMYGKMILNTTYKHTLDLSSLANGVYMLSLKDSKTNTQKTTKLIIAR